MNKSQAGEIARQISNEDIQRMLDEAKYRIRDWTVRSIVNKSFTRGTAWNILAKNFNVKKQYHYLTKLNMVREFGEFLPAHLKPGKQKDKGSNDPPIHQDPQF